MRNLGTTVRANVNAVSARLNGYPDTFDDWQVIARQLRTASDAARKIARLAGRMTRHEAIDLSAQPIDLT